MKGKYTYFGMQLFELKVKLEIVFVQYDTDNQVVHRFAKNLKAIWKLRSLERWQKARSIHRSLKYLAPAYKFICPGDIASGITALMSVSTVCVLYEHDVPESCHCLRSNSLLMPRILSTSFVTSATAQFSLTEIFYIFLFSSMRILLLTPWNRDPISW